MRNRTDFDLVKNCVLVNMTASNNPPTGLEFQIKDPKYVYVLVVILSKENDKKLLEQLKSGFKSGINTKWKCNKYRSKVTIRPQNNDLNYLIDPTFTKVNRLFVLSFARTATGDRRDSCSHCHVPNVRIKDFNVLIDGERFFDLSVKNEKVAYEKIIEMSRNNDYTTGNLLDFAYLKKNYKLIAIDLSKQTKLKDLQQINFIGKLLKNTGATMFFIIEKSEETTFNFLQNSVTII